MYRMTDSLPDSIPGFCRGTHFQPLREVMLTETKENCNRLIMTGDGKEVEVTGEVYDAWQKSRRHEKYQQERKKREREMSVTACPQMRIWQVRRAYPPWKKR